MLLHWPYNNTNPTVASKKLRLIQLVDNRVLSNCVTTAEIHRAIVYCISVVKSSGVRYRVKLAYGNQLVTVKKSSVSNHLPFRLDEVPMQLTSKIVWR